MAGCCEYGDELSGSGAAKLDTAICVLCVSALCTINRF
jgi:hypothetical protein